AAAKEAAGPYGQVVDLTSLRGPREVASEVHAAWELSGAESHQIEQNGPKLETSLSFVSGGAAPMPDAKHAALFGRFTRERPRGKFESFPANRRVPTEPLSSIPTPLSDADEAGVRLRKPTEKYASVPRVLQLLALATSLGLAESMAEAGLLLG